MKTPHIGYNETFQTRVKDPDDYENKLGDALEDAFKRQIHELAGIVTVLQDRQVPAPNQGSWSVELLTAELARLGT